MIELNAYNYRGSLYVKEMTANFTGLLSAIWKHQANGSGLKYQSLSTTRLLFTRILPPKQSRDRTEDDEMNMLTSNESLTIMIDEHEAQILEIQLSKVIARLASEMPHELSHVIDLKIKLRDFLRDDET